MSEQNMLAALATVKGIPGYGERVDADPSNWIRDLFFANQGRLTSEQIEVAIGRMTFTYGRTIRTAWMHLQQENYVERTEGGWVWPPALPSPAASDRPGCGTTN